MTAECDCKGNGTRCWYLLDADVGSYGEAGTQGVVFVFVLEVGEVDADGDALDDLDVVAGGVFGREEGEAGAGGSADLSDLAGEVASAKGVYLEVNLLAYLHSGELSFFKVGGYPEVIKGDDGEEILADGEVGAYLDVLFVDDAGDRCGDFGVREVELCLLDPGAGLLDLGLHGVCAGLLGLNLLGAGAHGLLSLGARLGETLLGLASGLLLGDDVGFGFDDGGAGGGGGGYGGVVLLLRDDVLLDEGPVAIDVELGLDVVGFGLIDAGGGGGDLVLRLSDGGDA